jgi:hypothetical protein
LRRWKFDNDLRHVKLLPARIVRVVG